jgi:predicted metal-dependent hydrolase
MMHQIKFGSRTIDFNLEYRKRKSLGIKVHPDNQVEVLAPFDAKEEKVLERVKVKASWIIKQIDYFNSYKPVTPKRRFVNGETHLYLGRQYKLKIVPDGQNIIKAYRGQLWIHAVDISPNALKLQLDSWYKQKATVIFNELLEEVLPKFNRYKIANPSLSIRHMSKRWGSCTPAGRIILNTELIRAPKGSIEYVIVHELSHLVHHNHTKAFQDLQARILPDWRKWKDRLEYSLT